jgi:hypothetical protein
LKKKKMMFDRIDKQQMMFDRIDKGTPDSCQISQMLVQEATATALIVA